MGMWLHTCEKKSIGLRRIQPLSLLAVANRLLTKCSYCSGDGFEITLRSRVLSISTFSCCVMCFGQGLRGCLLSRLGGFLLIVDPGQVHRRGDGSRRHGVHLGPATQGGLSEVYSTAVGFGSLALHAVNATNLRGFVPGFTVAIPTAPVLAVA